MHLRSAVACTIFAFAFVAAGCGNATNTISTPSPILTPGGAVCDASRAGWAAGQRATDQLLEKARADAGAKTARFLRPNDVITLEYSGERLNLRVDGDNIVRSVTCG